MRAFVCTPGFEDALRAELPAAMASPPGDDPAPWPGVVLRTEPVAPPVVDPVFARQQLPAVVAIRGDSIARLADAALDALAPDFAHGAGTFALFASTLLPDADAGLDARAGRVGERLRQGLAARGRRSARREITWEPGGKAPTQLVQVLLVGRDAALVSLAPPHALPRGGHDLAPWPAGLAPVAEDRAAPSRAYRKLREAFAWMGTAPGAGQTCVDLGGAPGGWSWTALALGARVTAIDRAPLAAAVRRHPRFRGRVGDAFTFTPERPVDWLLCDVIAEPPRTLALVERWLAERWCSRLVATVKFKGVDGYGVLVDLGVRLGRLGCRFVRIKHLAHNKNEVTIMARR